MLPQSGIGSDEKGHGSGLSALMGTCPLPLSDYYAIRVFLFRIGTVKNSKKRLVASGPTLAMIGGIRKFSAGRIDSI